jgi:hypothetical protein
MADLASIIFPALETADCRTITEIGAEGGEMTKLLLDFVKQRGGWMTSIDPDPSAAAEAALQATPFGVLHRDISIRAIPSCPATDVYLVDGDHNYFTVLQELLWIERIQQDAGKPFFALLHDVGWPCAYRDLYYSPDQIPEEWRQPFSWDRGLTLDNSGTIDGGFRGSGVWACALEEGGEKNGVLKAVEDFITAREGAIRMVLVPGVFGLGVLYSGSAPWAGRLQQQLAPFDRDPLLAKMERNRLENYLRVIELQDQLSNPRNQEEVLNVP